MKIIGRRKHLIVVKYEAAYYHELQPSIDGKYFCKHENSIQNFDFIEIDALKEVSNIEVIRKLDETKVETLYNNWRLQKTIDNPLTLNDILDMAEYIGNIRYNEGYDHAIDDCVSKGKANYFKNQKNHPDDFDDDKPEIEAYIVSESLYKLKKNAARKIK